MLEWKSLLPSYGWLHLLGAGGQRDGGDGALTPSRLGDPTAGAFCPCGESVVFLLLSLAEDADVGFRRIPSNAPSRFFLLAFGCDFDDDADDDAGAAAAGRFTLAI